MPACHSQRFFRKSSAENAVVHHVKLQTVLEQWVKMGEELEEHTPPGQKL